MPRGAASTRHDRCNAASRTITEEDPMNWDQVEGKWKEMKGKFRSKFGKLTDDDIEVIAGKKDQLIGRLQQRYGYTKDEAEREADDALKNF
jgi:uncharacterized protein YjbJ (UPF0337 family)